jgi:aspartate beta-hydroxylase
MSRDAASQSVHRERAFDSLRLRDFPRAERLFEELVTEGSLDPQDHFGLSMALYEQGRLEESGVHLAEACRIEPDFVHAWLYLGVVKERGGDRRAAAGAYLRADRLMNGTDPASIPPDVRALLDRGARFVGSALFSELSAELASVAARHGTASIERLHHAAEMFAGIRPLRHEHPRWRPGLFYVPGMAPRQFFEREEFPWVDALERQTDAIRDELRTALSDMRGFKPYVQYAEGSEQARVWRALNGSADWSTLHLSRHGRLEDEACARCPVTLQTVMSIPDLHDVPGYGPEIMFSVLRPKTRIPAHRGSVNGRLVVHLPLVVPPECGYLRVGDEQRVWQEGRALFFDDTFDHEAWNDSEQTRVVLIFDAWNPQLSEAEREAFRAVLSRAAAFEKELLGH